jgi:hypothetical protein
MRLCQQPMNRSMKNLILSGFSRIAPPSPHTDCVTGHRRVELAQTTREIGGLLCLRYVLTGVLRLGSRIC